MRHVAAPGHGEEGDAAVVGLGLADDAVVALVDGAARALDSRMLVRPVGLVIRSQPQREVQVVGLACHHRATVPDMRNVQHLQPPKRVVPFRLKANKERPMIYSAAPPIVAP